MASEDAVTTVWLVRHGEPVHVVGESDPPLTERGREQADRVARRLARHQADLIVSSPLSRALQTAQRIQEQLSLPDIEVVEGLAEADRYAPGGYVRIEELRQNEAAFEAFLADPVGWMGADEATFRQAVLDAFEHIKAAHRGRRVIAVSHGLVLNCMLASILDLKRLSHFAPHYASVSVLRHEDKRGWSALTINDVGHHDLLR